MKVPKLRIATVLIESNEQYGKTDNDKRLQNLLKIIKETSRKTSGSSLILFPAGYFNTGRLRANSDNYRQWTVPIKQTLSKLKKKRIVVCVGIDGRLKRNDPTISPKDQLALAIERSGIIGAARKFHPTKFEKDKIQLADDYRSKLGNKPRIIELNGRRFYLSVCYDIFGIRQKNLPNPGVDGILNLIHKFTARCQCETKRCQCGATSGEVYFARNGMAGASLKWNCPVYASTSFFNRKIPERWPSATKCKQNLISTKNWTYSKNQIKGNWIVFKEL